ncbi:hypothetical protein [Streptomyces sp. ODS28]|uniref:hypothetical protein n=1 Tax=Streptomyces sp. ODS28 TaxID=3136688 RepID=UPI0031E6D272
MSSFRKKAAVVGAGLVAASGLSLLGAGTASAEGGHYPSEEACIQSIKNDDHGNGRFTCEKQPDGSYTVVKTGDLG